MQAQMTQRELRFFMDGDFDAESYWRDKPYKKWVVEVGRWNGRFVTSQTVYVSAKTQEGAEATAKANTVVTGRLSARARLATPRDLGCTRP
ncbi:hypothetical protein BX589_12026 [Paraburkholderia fungorum]|jgi:hypothetical protein|uniref:hypothetical protein n=1 Tax=Paraburkholderia fungorum TaxID=134537 RepID=UPI000D058105|nr:hypothetical protein [Paraburkholderia fungorum]PRZ51185.1 hypothetical protein BX589_12026 [Paraburkholderia fungorum]